MVTTLLWCMMALIGGIPPMTPEQRIAVETAVDGRGHRESAFVALMEHVLTWPATIDVDDLPTPDVEAMFTDPEVHRANAVRLTGTLLDHEPLPAPFDRAVVWYVRLHDDTPVALYLPVRATSLAGSPPAPGTTITCGARFYKRLDGEDRRGRRAQWLAFVGHVPRTVAPAGATTPVPMLIVVVVMLIACVYLLFLARRPMVASRRQDHVDVMDEVEVDAPLPEDPAAALDELRQRARSGPT